MLARDKVYVLRCWLALGGKEDTLRRKYRDENYKWKMRDEPSDNLSEWLGVMVGGWRVTGLSWMNQEDEDGYEPLTGTIPAEIGALDGLTKLDLSGNEICGQLPPEMGRLTSLAELHLNHNCLEGPLPAELGDLASLTHLYLQKNYFAGEVPSTLANLTNLVYLCLNSNNFDTDVPSYIVYSGGAQQYLAWLNNPEDEPPFSFDENETDYQGP